MNFSSQGPICGSSDTFEHLYHETLLIPPAPILLQRIFLCRFTDIKDGPGSREWSNLEVNVSRHARYTHHNQSNFVHHIEFSDLSFSSQMNGQTECGTQEPMIVHERRRAQKLSFLNIQQRRTQGMDQFFFVFFLHSRNLCPQGGASCSTIWPPKECSHFF